jgi:hypothetical protein
LRLLYIRALRIAFGFVLNSDYEYIRTKKREELKEKDQEEKNAIEVTPQKIMKRLVSVIN